MWGFPSRRLIVGSHSGGGALIPGHGELLPSRRLSAIYLRENTDVRLEGVEAAVNELGRGILEIGRHGSRTKFGGYMLGGADYSEAEEHALLREFLAMIAA
jgi:hypothetical protein